LLVAISELASQQASGTKAIMRALTQLLNYATTRPNASIPFHASDMIIHLSSDASYMSVPKARSRAAGFFSQLRSPCYFPSSLPTDPDPPANGAIYVNRQIMREILSSAAEAELGALFHNGNEACPLRICLEELGHPQPPTPIQTDNSTASGITNDNVKQKRSKAINMCFYWIRDRVRQGQFHVYWSKEATTWLIILLNITPLPKTVLSVLLTSTRMTIPLGIISIVWRFLLPSTLLFP
jgi:hypothetical protein